MEKDSFIAMTYGVRSRLYATNQNEAYPPPYPPGYPEAYPTIFVSHGNSDEDRVRRIRELLFQSAANKAAAKTIAENIATARTAVAHVRGEAQTVAKHVLNNSIGKEAGVSEIWNSSFLSNALEKGLRRLTDRDRLDPIIGDLQERSLIILRNSGHQSAQQWYRRQLLKSFPAFFRAWLRGISGLEAICRRIGW